MNEIVKEVAGLFKVPLIYFKSKGKDRMNAKKAVVYLAYWSGYNYKDIQESLDMNINSVYRMKYAAEGLMNTDKDFLSKMKELL